MHSKIIAALVTLSIVATTFLTLHTLPGSGTMFSLEADTELLDVTVFNPVSNRISLGRAWDVDNKLCVQEVVLTPKRGATISYSRRMGGALYVYIDEIRSIETIEGLQDRVTDSARFVLDENRQDCMPFQSVRLPVNGSVSVGSESHGSPTQETLVASAMDVSVYGRAITNIVGVLPLTWEPFRPGALYLAEELTIPAGSRVSGALDGSGVLLVGGLY